MPQPKNPSEPQVTAPRCPIPAENVHAPWGGDVKISAGSSACPSRVRPSRHLSAMTEADLDRWRTQFDVPDAAELKGSVVADPPPGWYAREVHHGGSQVAWGAENRDGYAAGTDDSASLRDKRRQSHGHDHDDRRHGNLLQGLGLGPADRLQPRLAAVRRRLGHPDAVLPPARLPRHRP